MRIAATFKPNDDAIFGIASTFQALSHDFFFWNNQQKPAFDMFDELKPDILLCEYQDITTPIKKCLHEYQDTKLVLTGLGVPPDISPSLVCYPGGFSDIQIKNLHRIDCPYMIMKTAANLGTFFNGKNQPENKSDVLLISNNELLASSLVQYVSLLTEEHDVKIVGHVRLPLPEYLGICSLQTLCNLISSTTIGLDFSNKNSYDYAINKVFCISNLPNTIVPTFTKESLAEDVSKYLGSKKLRNKHIKESYEIAKENTYFHRVAEIFEKLGYDKENKESLKKVGDLLK